MGLTQITTGGVDDNINIDSNTLKVDGTNNRVGIGQSSPASALHVSGTTVARFQLSTDSTGHTSNDGVRILVDSSNNLEFLQKESANIEFFTASAERMRIDASGRVGIGTTSPTGLLHVTGSTVSRFLNSTAPTLDNNTHAGEALFLRSGGSSGSGNVQAVLALGKADSGSLRTGAAIGSIQTDSDADRIGLSFYTSPSSSSSQTLSEKLRITHDGNVGIGTSSPGGQLDVSGTSDTRVITRESGNSVRTDLMSQTSQGGVGTTSNHPFFIQTNGSERLRIDTSGRLGIGTTSPAEKLHVRGDVRIEDTSPRLGFHDSNASSIGYVSGGIETFDSSGNRSCFLGSIGVGGQVTIGTNDTERMRVDASGNVGIGTSSPGEEFVVRADAPSIQLESSNASGRNYGFQANNDGKFHAYDATAGANRITVDSSGNVGIGTTSPDRLFEVKGTQAGEFVAAKFSNGRDVGTDKVAIAFGLARSGGLTFDACKITAIKETTFTTTPSTIDAALGFETIQNESRTERLRITSSGQLRTHSEGNTTLKPMQGCRAFCCFRGTGSVSIFSSFNVSALTDVGTGHYQISFAQHMIDANYGVTTGFQRNGTADEFVNVGYDNTTARFRCEFFDSGNKADSAKLAVAVYR